MGQFAFSLSHREMGQSAFSVSHQKMEQFAFSLSHRERAGVRGRYQAIVTVLSR
jgi:hypothetical protein